MLWYLVPSRLAMTSLMANLLITILKIAIISLIDRIDEVS